MTAPVIRDRENIGEVAVGYRDTNERQAIKVLFAFQSKHMRIGILGSGLMGGKLGTIFARAGHHVIFSYARSEQKLRRLAREAQGHARNGTPADVARDADVLLLAVHWRKASQ